MTAINDDIKIAIEALPEDIPVRGNACASGDADIDRQVENEMLERLENGDTWAWCCVRVTATHPNAPGLEAVEFLGCCCYHDVDDFKKHSGYYEDMANAARTDLERQIRKIAALV